MSQSLIKRQSLAVEVFDGEQEVCAALGVVEEKVSRVNQVDVPLNLIVVGQKRAVRMQRDVLHQHTLKLDRHQQLAYGLDLATGIGGVGGLCNRHAQALGLEAHLGNETRCTRDGLGDRAPKCLAITGQGVELFRHIPLGRHPVAQQGFKTRHDQLGQQQAKGGIRRRLAEIGAQ